MELLDTSGNQRRVGDAKDRYAKAVRHSRRVWFLKWAFPSAALLSILAFTASTMISRALPEGATIGEVVVTDGKVIMSDPVMTGPVDETRNFSIAAARAIQELSVPSVIRLEDIVADLPVTQDDSAMLDAISGIYDREEDHLILDQPFTVTTESGVTAELQDASIDVDEGTLTTQKRVRIETAQARIVAQSLIMRDHGADIVFERDVQMVLNPGAVRSAAETTDDVE